MKKYWWQILIIALGTLTIGFTIGFFRGEKIYIWLIRPFNNADGEFDMGIAWTAFLGIVTLALALVSLIQKKSA